MAQTLDMPAAAVRGRLGPRVWIAAVAGAAFLTGFAPWGAGAGAEDAELALLLRFMAVLKGLTAVAALALALWRAGYPAGTGLLALYAGSCALMAAATGLIFNLDQVLAGAVLFHAGLFVFIGLALHDNGWRDAAATALPARWSRTRAR